MDSFMLQKAGRLVEVSYHGSKTLLELIWIGIRNLYLFVFLVYLYIFVLFVAMGTLFAYQFKTEMVKAVTPASDPKNPSGNSQINLPKILYFEEQLHIGLEKLSRQILTTKQKLDAKDMEIDHFSKENDKLMKERFTLRGKLNDPSLQGKRKQNELALAEINFEIDVLESKQLSAINSKNKILGSLDGLKKQKDILRYSKMEGFQFTPGEKDWMVKIKIMPLNKQFEKAKGFPLIPDTNFYEILALPNQLLSLMLTLSMGILGSTIYITYEYFKPKAPRPLSWFFFRPVMGMFMALAIYIFIRAGQSFSFMGSSTNSMQNENMNPFFISFVAIISGLLSEQAYAKIIRVGTTFFGEAKAEDAPRAFAIKNNILAEMKILNKDEISLAQHLHSKGESEDIIKSWIHDGVEVPKNARAEISNWLNKPEKELFQRKK